MTMRGYTKLSNLIKKAYNIPKKWMPSFAKLTENLPKMVGFELQPRLDTLINCPPSVGISEEANKTEIVQSLADVGLDVDLGDINDTSWTHDPLVPKTQKLELSSFAGTDQSLEDVQSQLKAARAGENVQVGKIEGSYEDYIKLLQDSYERRHDIHPEDTNLILIDSYDGARHHNTGKKETNIVSFSTKLLSDSSICDGYGGGTSLNILTWQQMRGDKAARTVYPAIESVLMNKYELGKKCNQDHPKNTACTNCMMEKCRIY